MVWTVCYVGDKSEAVKSVMHSYLVGRNGRERLIKKVVRCD